MAINNRINRHAPGRSSNPEPSNFGASNQQESQVFTVRKEQLCFDLSSSSDAMTLSHAETEDSEGSLDPDQCLAPNPNSISKEKKRKMSESLYSYNSRNASLFVKDEHGRTFNALKDAYLLPSDKPEWTRLALLIGFAGLVPCMDIVDAVLAPAPGEPRQILDIGCGTGIWAIEMAKKYPHAIVVGVDLAPVPIDQSLFPPNLRFEVDDINHGLEHFHDQFDLVHMRCVGGGITDYGSTMDDAQRCLRAGGLIIFAGGDGTLISEDRLHAAKFPTGDPNEEGSWLRKLTWEAWEACELAGSSLSLSQELIDHGLWNHPLCDPDTAVSGGVYLPIGPWKEDSDITRSQQLQYTGTLMRQVFLNVHRAFHGILLKQGMDQETLDTWSQKADEELSNQRVKLWVRFRFCWARRRAGPDLPAPPLPPVPLAGPTALNSQEQLSDDQAESDANTRYPFIEFYHSAAEATAQMQRRKDHEGACPESEVRLAWEHSSTQSVEAA